MGKTIRAKIFKGVIRPLEDLGIDEDKEVTITIIEIPDHLDKGDALDKTAGGWVGLVDAEELKRKRLSSLAGVVSLGGDSIKDSEKY